MIAALTGRLVAVDAGSAVVDVAGVGYRILCPGGALAAMPAAGTTITVHTHLHVREDALTLYGFGTADERDVFEVLISVNGIGPKGALGILSSYTPDGLRKAVLAEDLDALTLVPGVGRKTAARLVLELKERLGAGAGAVPAGSPAMRPVLAEARDALVALGYTAAEARDALEAVAAGNGETPATATLLKRALKRLGAAR